MTNIPIIDGDFIINKNEKIRKNGKAIKNIHTGKSEYYLSPLLNYKNAYFKDENKRKTLFLYQLDKDKKINEDDLIKLFRLSRKYAIENDCNLIIDNEIKLTDENISYVNNVIVNGKYRIPLTHKEMRMNDIEYKVDTVLDNNSFIHQYYINDIFLFNKISLSKKYESFSLPEESKVKIRMNAESAIADVKNINIETIDIDGNRGFNLSNVTFYQDDNNFKNECSIEPTNALKRRNDPVVVKLPKVEDSIRVFNLNISDDRNGGILKPLLPSREKCDNFIKNNGIVDRNIFVNLEPVEEQIAFINFVHQLKNHTKKNKIDFYAKIQKKDEEEYKKLSYDLHENFKTVSHINKLNSVINEDIYTDEIIKKTKEIIREGKDNINYKIE